MRIKLIIISLLLLVKDAFAKEIDSKTDLQQEESIELASKQRNLGSYLPHDIRLVSSASSSEAGEVLQPNSPSDAELWPKSRSDLPQIKGINVKCEKNHMKVNIDFDRPFYGMVFSKGHYSDSKCVHLPAGTGHLVASFDIYLGACGMSSNEQSGYSANGATTGLYTENTIVIQYDPQVQEIWDQARRLRCTWYDFYEKAVTFRPFNVDMLDAVTKNFLGDNIQCWMQIQTGKGPWASEVAGIVKIGQTMTMVLAIKDEENKFDMLVRNCIAHDGKHQPIQLVDEYGCIVRPKIMSKFQKVKNFGQSANVVSYAYFQAFKFPDSMNVHFQCVIQVCRYECPEYTCNADGSGLSGEDVSDNFISGPTPPKPPAPPKLPVDSLASGSHKAPVYKPSIYGDSLFMSRKGVGAAEINGTPIRGYANLKNVASNGMMPRAMRLDRTRRSTPNEEEEEEGNNQKSLDITSREKIIQVVAPGDVAFNLDTGLEESYGVKVSTPCSSSDGEICMSTTGFIGGLLLLVSLFILSCLVAGFLFLRLRTLARVASKSAPNTIVLPTTNSSHLFKLTSRINGNH